ncbi:MAG: AAA family ATPase, partial [Methanomassiliicoccaceae archaeon]|nr:AAA family ATPase [Methanomassiliicoccaceae archaeon]
MIEGRSSPSEEIRGSYLPRIIDSKVSEKLSAFGGVLITGPKSCGKSWTGLNHSKSAIFLGDEDINRYASLNPQAVLAGEQPRLVDEWQDVPKLRDVARRDIDLSNKKGMYIFTGSSTPPAESNFHTGIGRFARLQMRTMSLFESRDSSGSVRLSRLFDTGRAEAAPSSIDYPKA